MNRLLRNHRRALLCLFDIFCYIIVTFICFIGTFIDPSLEVEHGPFFTNAIVLALMIFTFRSVFGFYKNVWRYTYTRAYLSAILEDTCAAIVSIILAYLVRGLINQNFVFKMWQFVVMSTMFCLVTIGTRYAYRLFYKHRNIVTDEPSAHKINVAIVGAGQMGALLADELRCSKTSSYNPIAFIDKDKAKKGEYLGGVKIYYEDENIVQTVKKLPIQEIFIAMPGLDSEAISNLYKLYQKTGCKIKLYDTPVREIGEEEAQGKRVLREFQIEDLLFRKQLKINNRRSLDFYHDKVVLVTGGGGSIGSELCRQIAKLGPKKLIIVDIYENNAYDIQQELLRNYGDKLDLTVFIASVRDAVRIDTIFEKCRPDVVFHAAAHKHVPLMENNPCETIKNNVLGTYNTANAAERYGVEKFIMISTDKAVNPTNIMGASKRLCEMIIQAFDAKIKAGKAEEIPHLCSHAQTEDEFIQSDAEKLRNAKTEFVAVRFGNVLGSNGSVIPIFKKQIEAGGPVTVTHPDIIRYFMTIPEACCLVMEASTLGKGGEIFIFDMGKPVKILDLARNMIRLAGYTPEKDIPIVFTGLRPGEKLYEELLNQKETTLPTDNKKIMIARVREFDFDVVSKQIDTLIETSYTNKPFTIVYISNNSIYEQLDIQ